MAKKRDRNWTEHGQGAEEAYARGAGVAHEGMSFAGDRDAAGHQREEDLDAWGEDQETAPDLFAEASEEDVMQARDGHSRPDEEQKGRRTRPDVQRR